MYTRAGPCAAGPRASEPEVRFCCAALPQVGRGLAFLHHCGIAHGKLTSSNVVLKTSNEDRRGFTAKIGAHLGKAFSVTDMLAKHTRFLRVGRL